MRFAALRLLVFAFAIYGFLVTAHLPHANAACNLIPGTVRTYDSQLGATNRPFAAPGEDLEIKLRNCDPSPGFLPSGAQHVVTIVFKAPDGTNNVVALADDCLDIAGEIATCAGEPGVASAVCQDSATLRTRTDVDQGDLRLVFGFPNTDAEFAPAADGLTLSGQTAIAVTPKGDALPCGLATETCTDQSGLIACIDELYANDGACGTTVADSVFGHFTALPRLNNYQEDCFDESPPCNGGANEVRAAVDADGNLLMPVAWQGVLTSSQGIPVPRLVRTRLEAPVPFDIPSQTFIASYTPEGGLLPPILEPQLDPTVADPNVVTVFGSVDAPYTIIRIARRHGTCVDGPRDGEPCERDFDCRTGSCQDSCVDEPSTLCPLGTECMSGACGSLFDFSVVPDVAAGGPLAVERFTEAFCQLAPHQDCTGNPGICAGTGNACVAYAAEAQSPVPLDGLRASDSTRTFAANEAIDGVDRNGDGDALDFVVSIADRITGQKDSLDATAGCAGLSGTPDSRALVKVSRPPFLYPAVAVEGDVTAYLEREWGQNACDINGDADFVDAIVRVHRTGVGETMLADVRAADVESKIDGEPIVVSADKVFVRTSEASMAAPRVTRIFGHLDAELDDDSGDTILSADGRFIAFSSFATNLLPPGSITNGSSDVFRYEIATGDIIRISTPNGGGEANDSAFAWDISADGRYVLFISVASNLTADITNPLVNDVFIHDVDMGLTTKVSIAHDGSAANGSSDWATMSDDGRYVLFQTGANNFNPGVSPDTSGQDMYLWDRVMDSYTWVSIGPGGVLPNDDVSPAGGHALSDDGSTVVFSTQASNFAAGDSVATPDLFAYDVGSGTTTLAVEAFGGGILDGGANPVLSEDGSVLFFAAGGTNVLAPGLAPASMVYAKDMDTGFVEAVGFTNDGGSPASLPNTWLSASSPAGRQISADGRYILMPCFSCADLDPRFAPGFDLYRYDRISRTTERVGVAADGSAPNSSIIQGSPSMSPDGQTITFTSVSANLVALPDTDTNAKRDVFIREPDPTDPLGADIFANGVIGDMVLEVIDPTTGDITTLCEADDVSIAAGNAAFLRPETTDGTLDCPAGSLNGDGDTDDLVVHYWPGSGTAQNLGLAATDVALTSSLIAALGDEEGQNTTDLNGDGDQIDMVLHTRATTDGSWTNTGQAAEALSVSGDIAAFLSSETAQNASVLNGDGDSDDLVVHVYEHDGFGLRNLEQAAEELVLGNAVVTSCGTRQLLAFRTSEAAQGDGPLNGDGDTDDDVLQVYDVITDTVTNLGQAVVPCRLEICDPSAPYRVSGAQVKFLTLEEDQNSDLDGNGVVGGLVLQSYDACSGVVTIESPVDAATPSDPIEIVDSTQAFTAPGGRCSIEPPIVCDPSADTCPEGSICSPFTTNCTLNQPGACVSNDDCTVDSVCETQPVVVGITTEDADDDGVPDDLDNCPSDPNPLQGDDDDDGVGNACDKDSCNPVPLMGCRVPSEGGSSLQFKDKGEAKKRKLGWKWSKGPLTPVADFGDPVASDSYLLCVYDGGGRVSNGYAEAAKNCGKPGKPKSCWKATKTGYKFKDKSATPVGTSGLAVKGSDEPGKAKINVKGKGANVVMPDLAAINGPVLVQMQNTETGTCFEATYSAPFLKQDATQLKAKSD